LSRIDIHPVHQGHGNFPRIISALLAEQRARPFLVLDLLTGSTAASERSTQRLGLTKCHARDRGSKVT